MYKQSNTPKPISSYTSLKRKWQDSDVEDTSDADSIDESQSEVEDSDVDSDVCSLDTLLDALNESSSMSPVQAQQFSKQVAASLQSTLTLFLKEQTIMREWVEKLCSLISKCAQSSTQPLTVKSEN